ncbi:MAG: hypothetical protein LBH96_02340 [Candidatus Peribacteria bacterium]|nr:hypothetical protein [Candidatus Peribacteria bacterium]
MAFGLLVVMSLICSSMNNDPINEVILQALVCTGAVGLIIVLLKCLGRLFQGTFHNPE